jgi:hypothetical protein
MRIPLPLLGIVLCLAVVAGGALAESDTSHEVIGPRTSAALLTRYLPAQAYPSPDTLSLAVPAPSAALPPTAPESNALSELLEVRLLGLAGRQPPDPRRRVGSGDIALRLPLGDAFELHPGLRVDYVRHPFEELRTGDPTPMLGLSVRF